MQWQGDLAARMVAGIDRYLTAATQATITSRAAAWKPDYTSRETYEASVVANREHFRQIIGVVDPRLRPAGFELAGTTQQSSLVAKTEAYEIHAVRWAVLPGVNAEGLLLEPSGEPIGQIVALHDADVSPEAAVGLAPGVPDAAQFPRRLAEAGFRVIVPTLINRAADWSGHPRIRYTNQPHREFIYRMAFEMGRHIIGYEVQKVLAAVDTFEQEHPALPIGVAGYGEGGLIAFYSAAADTRIDGALVSGYFGPREALWSEPIYRNVWGLLEQFGDAEIARLIAPRGLVVEAVPGPKIDGPPPVTPQRRGAAPGAIPSPEVEDIRREFDRAKDAFNKLNVGNMVRFQSGGGAPLLDLADTLAVSATFPEPSPAPQDQRRAFDSSRRLREQFEELVDFTQANVRESEFTRRAYWAGADRTSLATWEKSADDYRDKLWSDVIGRLPDPTSPLQAGSRLTYETEKWKGYEVVLPVWPEVFAYGILLVPNDLKPGERRPVVVTQHGLEGRPQMLVDDSIKGPYHHYGARLADRGFIVFAPQNPYIGQDDFRVLQRKANPLGKSLFSFILGQHSRILEWLATLPFVEPDKIGFYGLSYGGKTAVRVPPLLNQYALSICSADFNEWIWKNTSDIHPHSYIYTGEYEMFEFNLGNTFNYSDMANMMSPRPFMVERGHHDGVAPDEWVAYEFAKVRRHYAELGIADKAEIEFFLGPHEIHGEGTFDFLHRHLDWPKR
ncbi:MAG: dienelactone hydrolase family protein [Acidobacteria bacterium]|nr:dienelactone hydrolase family protein [Acidobacteriota bacterium]